MSQKRKFAKVHRWTPADCRFVCSELYDAGWRGEGSAPTGAMLRLVKMLKLRSIDQLNRQIYTAITRRGTDDWCKKWQRAWTRVCQSDPSQKLGVGGDTDDDFGTVKASDSTVKILTTAACARSIVDIVAVLRPYTSDEVEHILAEVRRTYP
jgi:hypothetical protein